jgi:chromosome segregation ATPase
MGASVTLVGYLAREVAHAREKTVRFETDQRGAVAQLQTVRGQLKDAKEELARLEEDRARRARVVEGETGALHRELADARKERDALLGKYRAAAADRDRAAEDLLAARRELDGMRTDLAKAGDRTAATEATAKARTAEAEEARRRLAETATRVEALVRPLLQDLRSPDGSIRVRAHEALCAFAGRDLPFRTNGTPEEREADAIALETILLGRQGGR